MIIGDRFRSLALFASAVLALETIGCTIGVSFHPNPAGHLVPAPPVDIGARAWSLAQTPPVDDGYLFGVACPRPDDCWAVGFTGLSNMSRPLLVHYIAGAWSVVNGPSVRGRLFGIACPRHTACWAVGGMPSPHGAVPLIEQYTAGRWATVSLSDIGGLLQSVSCPEVND